MIKTGEAAAAAGIDSCLHVGLLLAEREEYEAMILFLEA